MLFPLPGIRTSYQKLLQASYDHEMTSTKKAHFLSVLRKTHEVKDWKDLDL